MSKFIKLETQHAKEFLPSPEKLRFLADWFDKEQQTRDDWVETEVQDDLRMWANNIEILLGKE